MATLEKIRSKAGLLVTTIGLALFAFIIGDLFTGGQTFWRQSQDKVVTINGERVTTETFQKNVDDMTEIYKMQSGQNSLPAEYVQQINQQVYENIIREALIGEEAEKLGMSVSKAELADLVSGDHISPILQQMPFFRNQETGAFDKTLLTNFVNSVVSIEAGAEGQAASAELEQARRFWMFWEKSIKKQRLEDKYTSMLSNIIMPNSLDVKAQFEGGVTSVDFVYAKQNLSTIPDSAVTVSKSEITKYYDKVKDLRFKQDATRSIKYFSVDILPSEEDFAAANEDITKAREEFSTTKDVADFVNLNSETPYFDAFVAVNSFPEDERQFVLNGKVDDVYGPYLEENTYKMFRLMAVTSAPDSVKARHIMIPMQDEVKSLQLADSLLNVLNNGGDFAKLALEFSADRNSAQNGGEIGWFTEIAALRGIGLEFKNACFEAPLNKFFTIRTTYGISIAQVTDKTKNIQKAKVAEYAVAVTPSSRTFQKIYGEINQFIAVNNTIEMIDKAAPEKGYNIMIEPNLSGASYNLGTIQDARQAVRWAFQNKPGKISEVFETTNKFIVVAVVGETPAGYTPLAKVESSIKRELAAPKKAEKIVAELSAKNLSSLADYAQAMSSSVDTAKFVTFNTNRITGIGSEAILSGSAPFAQPNQLSAPLAGKNAVYVYSVYNKTESDAPFNAETEKQTLEGNLTYRLMYQSMQVLRNRADIQDYRVNFY
ncbi:MAG: SurA N-terminal domain-containing protein [Bacteroidales bacterium]|nr:SurA N-terminal domain-containing protein [Bacteroidales bacterium]